VHLTGYSGLRPLPLAGDAERSAPEARRKKPQDDLFMQEEREA